MCRDILTVAGPQVKAQLTNGEETDPQKISYSCAASHHVCCVCVAKVKRGEVFQTPPGSFPCKAIFHVCGQKDAGVIEQLVCRIIQQCDSFRYKSVAIPAICAGKYCERLCRKEPWGDKWPLLYHPATLYNILLINMIYLVIYELNYCSFADGVFVHFYMTKKLHYYLNSLFCKPASQAHALYAYKSMLSG